MTATPRRTDAAGRRVQASEHRRRIVVAVIDAADGPISRPTLIDWLVGADQFPSAASVAQAAKLAADRGEIGQRIQRVGGQRVPSYVKAH